MTLVNALPCLLAAQSAHYAIGAFNANTLEQLQAIVAAAELERAPVIVQISHRALVYLGAGDATLGLRHAASMGAVAAMSASVPVALHLDHGTEPEVREAMRIGFTSVMFDGGDLSYEENVRVTSALREQAHGLGVCIEGELGQIPRADETGAYASSSTTDPVQAQAFARATQVDALAVAIGSAHAIRSKRVRLDLDALKAIRDRVSCPLVLHGSSGVADEDIKAGVALGLCKINVATQLNQAFTDELRGALAASPDQIDPRRYLTPARDAVVARVRERIRFFGSAGKAS